MPNEALQLNEEILIWKRERFLKDLISGHGSRPADFKERLTSLHLHPFYSFPAVALLEPASSSLGSEGRIHMERVRDELENNSGRELVFFEDDSGRIAILFSWKSRELVETIPFRMKERFGLGVSIGVSKPCGNLTQLHLSYQQSLKALQSKFYQGTGQIIYYKDIYGYRQLQEVPDALEKQLFDKMKAAEHVSEIRPIVDDFYRSLLGEGPLDIRSMYELTIRLLVRTEKRVLSEAENVSVYKRYEVMSIVKMETLEEIKIYVSDYLAVFKELLSRHEKDNHRSIIKKSIQYMEQECQHATLQSVAQKVYMTPTYLSLIFKMNTGKTFIEQLTDIRMDKAKHMLKNTHLKNYEVAEKVGYQDSRYFSQIFKKKVGLSPSEYRDSVLQ